MRAALRRPPLPRLLVVAVLAVVATGMGPWVGTATADDAAVEVRLDGYDPAEITVQVGDTVTWTWATDGHSVTHDPGEGDRAFDSHPDCTGFVRRFDCGARGEEFAHTFDSAGTYPYVSRMDENVRGTVVVEPAPTDPAPTDPATSPSPTPSEEQSTEPTEDPDDESAPTRDPDGSDDPAPDDDPDDGPHGTTSHEAPAQQFSSSGNDSGGEASPPEVATAEPSSTASTPAPAPSFEDFPEPTETLTEVTDVAGEVAVGGDDGPGTARLVWRVLGGAAVLGTAGVFSRAVLFGDAWGDRQ